MSEIKEKTGKRPGGEIATRELHFFWILDCSSSMNDDGKIQELNHAIEEALPHMRTEAKANPHAKLIVKAIKFSDGATIHITDTPVDDFKWINLSTEGLTEMGKALSLVADGLEIPPMPQRGFPPVLVLVSDGRPTDDFNAGLKKLMSKNWGKKAVRIAIAIGKDAKRDVLQKFIGHSEIKPLEANTPEKLAKMIKWVSTVVVKVASTPSSLPKTSGTTSKTPIPTPPVDDNPIDDDVW